MGAFKGDTRSLDYTSMMSGALGFRASRSMFSVLGPGFGVLGVGGNMTEVVV